MSSEPERKPSALLDDGAIAGLVSWVTQAKWRGIPLQYKPLKFYLSFGSGNLPILDWWVVKPERKSTGAPLNHNLSPWPWEIKISTL